MAGGREERLRYTGNPLRGELPYPELVFVEAHTQTEAGLGIPFLKELQTRKQLVLLEDKQLAAVEKYPPVSDTLLDMFPREGRVNVTTVLAEAATSRGTLPQLFGDIPVNTIKWRILNSLKPQTRSIWIDEWSGNTAALLWHINQLYEDPETTRLLAEKTVRIFLRGENASRNQLRLTFLDIPADVEFLSNLDASWLHAFATIRSFEIPYTNKSTPAHQKIADTLFAPNVSRMVGICFRGDTRYRWTLPDLPEDRSFAVGWDLLDAEATRTYRETGVIPLSLDRLPESQMLSGSADKTRGVREQRPLPQAGAGMVWATVFYNDRTVGNMQIPVPADYDDSRELIYHQSPDGTLILPGRAWYQAARPPVTEKPGDEALHNQIRTETLEQYPWLEKAYARLLASLPPTHRTGVVYPDILDTVLQDSVGWRQLQLELQRRPIIAINDNFGKISRILHKTIFDGTGQIPRPVPRTAITICLKLIHMAEKDSPDDRMIRGVYQALAQQVSGDRTYEEEAKTLFRESFPYPLSPRAKEAQSVFLGKEGQPYHLSEIIQDIALIMDLPLPAIHDRFYSSDFWESMDDFLHQSTGARKWQMPGKVQRLITRFSIDYKKNLLHMGLLRSAIGLFAQYCMYAKKMDGESYRSDWQERLQVITTRAGVQKIDSAALEAARHELIRLSRIGLPPDRE